MSPQREENFRLNEQATHLELTKTAPHTHSHVTSLRRGPVLVSDSDRMTHRMRWSTVNGRESDVRCLGGRGVLVHSGWSTGQDSLDSRVSRPRSTPLVSAPRTAQAPNEGEGVHMRRCGRHAPSSHALSVWVCAGCIRSTFPDMHVPLRVHPRLARARTLNPWRCPSRRHAQQARSAVPQSRRSSIL